MTYLYVEIPQHARGDPDIVSVPHFRILMEGVPPSRIGIDADQDHGCGNNQGWQKNPV